MSAVVPPPQQQQQQLRLHSQVPDALLKTRAFDSLEAVLATGRDACGGPLMGARQPILRCSAELFNLLHHNATSDFRQFPALFDGCVAPHNNTTAPTKKEPKHPVYALAEESVLGAKSGSFMAPMCSPLTLASCSRYLRTSLETRTTADPSKSAYYVMEKSDGLRVIMVSQLAYNFPQWRVLRRNPNSITTTTSETAPSSDSGNTSGCIPPFVPFPSLGLGLSDVARLEKAYMEVRDTEAQKAAEETGGWSLKSTSGRELKRVVESSQFRLSSDAAPFVLRRVASSTAEAAKAAEEQFGSSDESNRDILVLVQKTDMGDGNEVLIHRRLTTRHFSYVFDRSMSGVYLLYDEIPFAGVSHAVLDGELILTAPEVAQSEAKIPKKTSATGTTKNSNGGGAGTAAPELESVVAVRMRRQLLFAIFDVFSYSTVADDVARKAADATYPSPPKTKGDMRELCRAGMWDRYTHIQQTVLGPMFATLAAASNAQQQPIQLSIMPFRKQMWPLEQLPDCIRLITAVPTKDLPESKVLKILLDQQKQTTLQANTKTANSSETSDAVAAAPPPPNSLLEDEVTYLFAGKSYNDGLIFTPAEFDVVSGSRADQLKWKFPDKLTVDWTITKLMTKFDKKDAFVTHADRGGNNNNARKGAAAETVVTATTTTSYNYYKIDMFFRRRAMNMIPETSGPTEYHRSRPLLNPHGFVIPDVQGVVAECTFIPREGKWCIERLRRDKTESNSVHTVISVLESIAEKIDVLKLMRVLSFIPILSPAAAFGGLVPTGAGGGGGLFGGGGAPPAVQAEEEEEDEDDGVTTIEERRALRHLKSTMAKVAAQCQLVQRCLSEERASIDSFLQSAQGTLTAAASVDKDNGDNDNGEGEETVAKDGAELTPTSLLPPYPKTAYLSLKNSRAGGLTLQWQVKLTSQRNPLAANQCRAKECYGLGEPCPEELGWALGDGGAEDDAALVVGAADGCSVVTVRSKLKERLLIELGNQGGSCAWSDTVVECLYDPTRGRWGLIDFPTLNVSQAADLESALSTLPSVDDESTLSPEMILLKAKRAQNINKNNTYATQLIQHLEAVCTYVFNNSAVVDYWSCVNTMSKPTTILPSSNSSSTNPILDAFVVNPMPFPSTLKTAYNKVASAGATAGGGGCDDSDLDKLKAQLADAHYAQRTRDLHHERKLESPLRCFNNWIKMMLMQRALTEVRPRPAAAQYASQIPQYHPGYATFEVCCGRGGDLFKWKPLLQAPPAGTPNASGSSSSSSPRGDYSGSFLFMADVCEEAVAEAASRYSCAPGLSTKIQKGKDGHPGVPAYFFVEDCFSSRMLPTIRAMKVVIACERKKKAIEDQRALKLSNAMQGGGGGAGNAGQKRARVDDVVSYPTGSSNERDGGAGGFDFVSSQFCIHYAFHSKASVRSFLANVSTALRPGGLFFGTTVDERILQARRAEAGDTFGNAHYTVSFAGRLGTCVDDDNDGDYSNGAEGGGGGKRVVVLEGDDQKLPASEFGTAYSIQVENAVTGEIEYTVPWDEFVTMCATEFELDVIPEASVNFEQFASSAWGEGSSEVGTKLYKESFKGMLAISDDRKSSANNRNGATTTSNKADEQGEQTKGTTTTTSKHSPQDWLEGGGTKEAAYLYKTFIFKKRDISMA